MAKDGSRGPRPYTQHSASTVFLRVPVLDWPLVSRGRVPEFIGSMGQSSAVFNTPTPTPCVAYTVKNGSYDARLMILEEHSQEPLGILAAESRRFGIATKDEFRRYWMRREGRKFAPTRNVFVYRVRPFIESDREEMGRLLFNRLYGEFSG